jgi:hypothetical protein
VPLALAGGTILGSSYYRGQFLDALATRRFEIGGIREVRDPAGGAIELARKCLRERS